MAAAYGWRAALSRAKHRALSGGLIHHVSCQPGSCRPTLFNAWPGGLLCVESPNAVKWASVCGVNSLMYVFFLSRLPSLCCYVPLTYTCHAETKPTVTCSTAVRRNKPEKSVPLRWLCFYGRKVMCLEQASSRITTRLWNKLTSLLEKKKHLITTDFYSDGREFVIFWCTVFLCLNPRSKGIVPCKQYHLLLCCTSESVAALVFIAVIPGVESSQDFNCKWFKMLQTNWVLLFSVHTCSKWLIEKGESQ